jgi:hypothetical protein
VCLCVDTVGLLPKKKKTENALQKKRFWKDGWMLWLKAAAVAELPR